MADKLMAWLKTGGQIPVQEWVDRVMALPASSARHKVASLVFWDFLLGRLRDGPLFELVMDRNVPEAEDVDVLEMLVAVGYPQEVAAKRMLVRSGYDGLRSKQTGPGNKSASTLVVGSAALLYEIAVQAIGDLKVLQEKGIILPDGSISADFPGPQWPNGFGEDYRTRGDVVSLVEFFKHGHLKRMCLSGGLDLNAALVLYRLGLGPKPQVAGDANKVVRKAAKQVLVGPAGDEADEDEDHNEIIEMTGGVTDGAVV